MLQRGIYVVASLVLLHYTLHCHRRPFGTGLSPHAHGPSTPVLLHVLHALAPRWPRAFLDRNNGWPALEGFDQTGSFLLFALFFCTCIKLLFIGYWISSLYFFLTVGKLRFF